MVDSKAEIEELLTEKAKGTIFRTKTKWYEEAEANTKYFFNLEKRRYNARLCNKLLLETGEILENPKKILQEQERYYRELFKTDSNITFNLENTANIYVPKGCAQNMNEAFSKYEISNALKGLNNNKMPGEDGIPPDFYKVFFLQLGDPMYEMINAAYESKKLPDSICTGIINLIPKVGRDKRKLSNLRAITLLNGDYKVVEKAIANRLQPVLEDFLISSDQKGFMRNRRISVNIRKVLDIMHYMETQQLEGIILSLDFMKCFDKIEKSAILGSLRYFGFCDYLIEWTEIIYNTFSAKVQNNGYFSPRFPIEKGVHQGGCASTMFFLICAEVLALELKGNPDIQGIFINGCENLLDQFADDMDIFSLYEEKNINAILETLEKFKNHSGFTINYDKTQIYRIGSLYKTDAKLITQKVMQWTNEPIICLGVKIMPVNENLCENNYEPVIGKIKGILQLWRQRQLSLIGKVQVVNTLIASLFVYKMLTLPTISEEIVKKVEDMILKFIWNGHKPKISLKTLQASKTCGGLKLIDLRKRDAALKTTWPGILTTDNKLSQIVYLDIGCVLNEQIWRCNLEP